MPVEWRTLPKRGPGGHLPATARGQDPQKHQEKAARSSSSSTCCPFSTAMHHCCWGQEEGATPCSISLQVLQTMQTVLLQSWWWSFMGPTWILQYWKPYLQTPLPSEKGLSPLRCTVLFCTSSLLLKSTFHRLASLTFPVITQNSTAHNTLSCQRAAVNLWWSNRWCTFYYTKLSRPLLCAHLQGVQWNSEKAFRQNAKKGKGKKKKIICIVTK